MHRLSGAQLWITGITEATNSYLVRVMPDGVIAQIGHGACPWPVRFAFALDAQTELPAGHAVVFDSRAPITLDRHAVWLR